MLAIRVLLRNGISPNDVPMTYRSEIISRDRIRVWPNAPGECPPTLAGHHLLLGDGDSWLYARTKQLWPACERRVKESRTEPCGCQYQVARCEHPESEHFGQEVRPRQCRACPLLEIKC